MSKVKQDLHFIEREVIENGRVRVWVEIKTGDNEHARKIFDFVYGSKASAFCYTKGNTEEMRALVFWKDVMRITWKHLLATNTVLVKLGMRGNYKPKKNKAGVRPVSKPVIFSK